MARLHPLTRSIADFVGPKYQHAVLIKFSRDLTYVSIFCSRSFPLYLDILTSFTEYDFECPFSVKAMRNQLIIVSLTTLAYYVTGAPSRNLQQHLTQDHPLPHGGRTLSERLKVGYFYSKHSLQNRFQWVNMLYTPGNIWQSSDLLHGWIFTTVHGMFVITHPCPRYSV